MHIMEWNQLMAILPCMSAEMKLGLKVLEDIMYVRVKGVKDVLMHECYWCKHEVGSHICPSSLDGWIGYIAEKDFVLLLAQEACRRNIVLQTPSLTLAKINRHFYAQVRDRVQNRLIAEQNGCE